MAGVALVDGEVFEGRAGQDRVDVEQFPRVWGRSKVGSGVSVRILISETVSHASTARSVFLWGFVARFSCYKAKNTTELFRACCTRWASAGIYFVRCIMPTEWTATNSVFYVLAEPLRQYRS